MLALLPGLFLAVAPAVKHRVPAASASTNRTAPQYEMTDLGVLPGMDSSVAMAINNHGQIVGDSGTRQWYGEVGAHPFLYDHGQMIDLGLQDGQPEGSASGINDNGWIAVTMQNLGAQPPQRRAYLWKNGTYVRLPVARPYTGSSAGSINNGNILVGAYENANGDHFAFIRDVSGIRRLKTPPGYAFMFPKKANDRGDLVGTVDYGPDGGLSRAVVIKNRHARILPSADGKSSAGEGINNRGQIVGWFETKQHDKNFNNITHGFLWRSGQGMTDIGSLGGIYCEANAINDRGVIVGESQVRGSSDYHACVWIDGKAIDLNTRVKAHTDFLLKEAFGINDRGQIVGDGIVDGHQHAFLLTSR